MPNRKENFTLTNSDSTKKFNKKKHIYKKDLHILLQKMT